MKFERCLQVLVLLNCAVTVSILLQPQFQILGICLGLCAPNIRLNLYTKRGPTALYLDLKFRVLIEICFKKIKIKKKERSLLCTLSPILPLWNIRGRPDLFFYFDFFPSLLFKEEVVLLSVYTLSMRNDIEIVVV